MVSRFTINNQLYIISWWSMDVLGNKPAEVSAALAFGVVIVRK